MNELLKKAYGRPLDQRDWPAETHWPGCLALRFKGGDDLAFAAEFMAERRPDATWFAYLPEQNALAVFP